MTANLMNVCVVWIRERQRSVRAREMARCLPYGSRYAENYSHVMIEIGPLALRNEASEYEVIEGASE